MSKKDVVQKILDKQQIAYFDSKSAVNLQVEHFLILLGGLIPRDSKVILDVGGGRGYFAAKIYESTKCLIRVLDSDENSIDAVNNNNNFVTGVLGDALYPHVVGDESVVCFNLILHHLIGNNELETRQLQQKGLSVWKDSCEYIFVNEIMYESYLSNFSGRIIYEITKNKILSIFGKIISLFIPSLRANTFGVGVRFRSHEDWVSLFAESGFDIISKISGEKEPVSFFRRLLLIKEMRRDSFLLSVGG
jgi:hypothetical protein